MTRGYGLVWTLGIALVAACVLTIAATRAAIGEAMHRSLVRSLQQHGLHVALILHTSADPDAEIRRLYASFAEDPYFAWNHGGFLALRARDGELAPIAASRQVEHLLAPPALARLEPQIRATTSASGARVWNARDERGVRLMIAQLHLADSGIVLLQAIETLHTESLFLAPFGASAAVACIVLTLLAWSLGRAQLRFAESRLALEHEEAQNALLEARVRGRTRELEDVNEALEAFTSSVSHDLLTPLRGIIHFARTLREEHAAALGTEGKACVERVVTLSGRMRDLVDSLLMLSRIGHADPRLESVDLGALAQEVWAELAELEPDRKVDLALGERLHARGDPGLLRILLENLLGNARKYSAQRGDPRVELAALTEGATPVYVVRDNGVGFRMEDAARLFQPFERLHSAESFPGSGIGLATVRRIVERHGGRVWAESRPGQGAAFYFTLSA